MYTGSYLNFGLIAGLIDSDRRLFLFIGREFAAPMWPRFDGLWWPSNGDFPATKRKMRVIKFAAFSNQLNSIVYIDAQQRYLARGLDLDSFPFVSVRSTDKSLVPFCAAECVGDCNAKWIVGLEAPVTPAVGLLIEPAWDSEGSERYDRILRIYCWSSHNLVLYVIYTSKPINTLCCLCFHTTT